MFKKIGFAERFQRKNILNEIAKNKPHYLTTAESLKKVTVKVLFGERKGNIEERETYL